ncbi:MAG: hypothetical protein JXX28_18855 [Deltaproteobacteria bacterium]|nr:hypothetical protein [Deltaproteobacteria bacterium]
MIPVLRWLGWDVARALGALALGLLGVALAVDGVERGAQALALAPERLGVGLPVLGALAGVWVGGEWRRTGRWTAWALTGRSPGWLVWGTGAWGSLWAALLVGALWGAAGAVEEGPLPWGEVSVGLWVRADHLDVSAAEGLVIARVEGGAVVERIRAPRASWAGDWRGGAGEPLDLPSPPALSAIRALRPGAPGGVLARAPASSGRTAWLWDLASLPLATGGLAAAGMAARGGGAALVLVGAGLWRLVGVGVWGAVAEGRWPWWQAALLVGGTLLIGVAAAVRCGGRSGA